MSITHLRLQSEVSVTTRACKCLHKERKVKLPTDLGSLGSLQKTKTKKTQQVTVNMTKTFNPLAQILFLIH